MLKLGYLYLSYLSVAYGDITDRVCDYVYNFYRFIQAGDSAFPPSEKLQNKKNYQYWITKKKWKKITKDFL